MRSRFGYGLLVAAPVLAVAAYYCAWRAGCYFDGKQGTGDIQAAEPWSLAALVAVALVWVALSAGVPLARRSTVGAFLGSAVFFAVLVLPLGILLLLAAESSGVRDCQSSMSAAGCAIEGPADRVPDAVGQLRLGMSKAEVERHLGPADYSPVEGQYYFSTGGDCPLDDEGREASCGVVAEFRPGLASCWWGAIGE